VRDGRAVTVTITLEREPAPATTRTAPPTASTPTLPPPAVVKPAQPVPPATTRAPQRPGDVPRTAAIVATVSAGALTGLGLAAFLVAGHAHDEAVATCAARTTSCDDLRGPIHTWDALALGAWIGAAAATTVAVILWVGGSREGKARGSAWIGPARAAFAASF
jgi:hypothetical protein